MISHTIKEITPATIKRIDKLARNGNVIIIEGEAIDEIVRLKVQTYVSYSIQRLYRHIRLYPRAARELARILPQAIVDATTESLTR